MREVHQKHTFSHLIRFSFSAHLFMRWSDTNGRDSCLGPVQPCDVAFVVVLCLRKITDFLCHNGHTSIYATALCEHPRSSPQVVINELSMERRADPQVPQFRLDVSCGAPVLMMILASPPVAFSSCSPCMRPMLLGQRCPVQQSSQEMAGCLSTLEDEE